MLIYRTSHYPKSKTDFLGTVPRQRKPSVGYVNPRGVEVIDFR